ncbi:MAG: class I SAM-dependent methyltransferase [Halobacteriota archaeon]
MEENVKFKEEVRRHFDERAARYDNDTETIDVQDFDNFKTAIPYLIKESGPRILEVATGTGIILQMLLKAGKDAHGIDLSRGLLQVAETKRSIASARLQCGDAEHLPYPDASFNAVCLLRSLHHMECPATVLREMIRCAKKSVFIYDSAGGSSRLIKRVLRAVGLYQPVYYLVRGRKDTGYRPANETEGPVKVFYAEDVIPILKREGLRIVNVMRLPGNLFVHAEKQTQ